MYRNVSMLYIQYMYTLHIHMSANGVVTHHIG